MTRPPVNEERMISALLDRIRRLEATLAVTTDALDATAERITATAELLPTPHDEAYHAAAAALRAITTKARRHLDTHPDTRHDGEHDHTPRP